MKKILTKIVKKIVGKNYIHIPKSKLLLRIVKAVLVTGKVRGRGRNWKNINEDNLNVRRLQYDGSVPMRYASYFYVPLK